MIRRPGFSSGLRMNITFKRHAGKSKNGRDPALPLAVAPAIKDALDRHLVALGKVPLRVREAELDDMRLAQEREQADDADMVARALGGREAAERLDAREVEPAAEVERGERGERGEESDQGRVGLLSKPARRELVRGQGARETETTYLREDVLEPLGAGLAHQHEPPKTRHLKGRPAKIVYEHGS